MMDKHVSQLRQGLVEYGKKMVDKGLVFGPGGNISARHKNIMYISPSGFSLDETTADDYVAVEINSGKVVEGQHRPSAGILKHLFCYRVRDDINVVLHAHSPKAISLSCTQQTAMPIFPDFVVYLGEEVPLVKYITPTIEELARAVSDVISKHNAVLMQNHGSIVVGTNLKEAFWRLETLEIAIGIQIDAMLMGKPYVLTHEECEAIKSLESEQYREGLLKKALNSSLMPDGQKPRDGNNKLK